MSDSGDPSDESQATVTRSFVERLIGALKLDASVYEEVEHDPQALGQAAGVVALASLARGLASAGVAGAGGVFGGILAGFVGWVLGTLIIWLIGVQMFRHSSDFPELLRTLGFASAPQIALVVAILPLGPLSALIALAVLGVSIAAFVIAVRQALDVTTGRAVFVCVLALMANLSLGIIFAPLL